MDSLKRFKKHKKTIQKIVDMNNKNPFTKIWKQMDNAEKTTYMGMLEGTIVLPEETMEKYDNNLYEVFKQFELKMTEKYGSI